MRILVVYDGSLNSVAALQYGLEKVKEQGAARLIAIHVFHRGMFIDYDVLPFAEEIARRASFRCAEDAKTIISESGEDFRAKVVMAEGEPEEEIIWYVEDQNIDLLLSPPRYKAVAKKAACSVRIVRGQAPAPP